MVRTRDGKIVKSPRKQPKNEFVVLSTKEPLPPSTSGSTDNTAAFIRVVVRVRPPNAAEEASNHRIVIQPIDERNIIFDPKEDCKPFFYQGVKQPTRNFLKRANKELRFIFNNVFYKDAGNNDVFEGSTKEVITSLFDGYNCSVFAYGATGAGKTYTMIGTREHPGITYLTMQELFRVIESHQLDREFEIRVSYLEVYNENVYDLLQPNKSLVLREDSKYGVIVTGLTINRIDTARELLDMLDAGNRNRTQHPTDANSESSRSHAVFQVYMKMTSRTTGLAQMAKLSMIDLAGSERAAATNCSGDRFKEGANINRSLLALGNCINKLADGSKFIPYRDSKLTRLLKDSLGGNCRTVMIANISPSSMTYDDTYNTLKYASRASSIHLHMRRNLMGGPLSITHYVNHNKELMKEVEMLKKLLAARDAVGGAPTLQIKVENTTTGEVSLNDPSEDSSKLSAWTTEINSAHDRLSVKLNKLVELMSEQRCMLQRAFHRRVTLKQLESLAVIDSIDSSNSNMYKKVLRRHESAVESLSQSVVNFEKKIEACCQDYNSTRINTFAVYEKAMAECPSLTSLVELKKEQIEHTLSTGRVKLLKKVSSQLLKETDSLNPLITVVPKLLRKYYLYLKGYGKITTSMDSKYKSVFNKLKESRNVQWKDEMSDEPSVSGDPIFDFVTNLDVANPLQIPYLPGFSGGPNDTVDDDEEVISTDLTEGTPTKKRRAEQPNETIVLSDSIDEPLADLTHVISNRHVADAFSTSEQAKEINVNNLNSTFVLNQKNSLPLMKPKAAVMPDLRKMHCEERVPMKVVKPLFRNPVLPRTPIVSALTQAPSNKENKAAFGSTTGRFPYNGAGNTLAGGKTQSRAQNRARKALPYARPNAYCTPTPSGKGMKNLGTPQACGRSNHR